ncbi:MAG: hypothetical protein ACI4QD_07225, partial [Kiritimatiellia bacterium]
TAFSPWTRPWGVGGGGSEGSQAGVVHGACNVQAFFGWNGGLESWKSAHNDLFTPTAFCTYADGAIRWLNPALGLEDINAAMVLDNITITTNSVPLLVGDRSVNSIWFSAGGVTLDLGGHTLRVASGMVGGNADGLAIVNGRVCIGDRPLIVVRNRGMVCGCDLATEFSDPERLGFAYYGWSGNWSNSSITFSGTNRDFCGRMFFSPTAYGGFAATFKGAESTGGNMTLDGFDGVSFVFDGGGAVFNLRGVSGCCQVDSTRQVNALVLGDAEGFDYDREGSGVYVAQGGFVEPGVLNEDGVREGTMVVSGHSGGGSKRVVFGAGSQLRIQVGKAMTATRLECANFAEGVELGGELVLREQVPVEAGTVVTLLTSTAPITGAFEKSPADYRLQVVSTESGYALTATRKHKGISFLVY